ncbi:zinc metalloprotease [Tenggerimyces flavus]|uniref:Peptidase M43 pregnancy-associated plasma-A domain-containing protein n=1 Tax=Tenggerimyces flavus TaxID=1708749 RepID=A0ABV7YGH5_9ACTN|nr:hypothetical protein [Tenggerimyces flavus]MBM7786031.1 hypothetical protein [Tenggerimyces flavus]
MKRLLVGMLAVFVAGSFLAAPSASATSAAAKAPAPAPQGAKSQFKGLDPGKTQTLRQQIPVNVVFVGFDKISASKLKAELPKSYEPVVRAPQFYGLAGRDMGLRFDFKYNVIDTNRRFEDKFFGFLAKKGKTNPLTVYQQQYNDQLNNVLDVTPQVKNIDAVSVESWLASNGRSSLGISPRSYTVYYLNWFGRKDFKYHVYTKTDEPDPDTGYNFGEQRASRKLIAWGGTNSRSWFFDPSAGPEAWSGSWNVDDADLDGDDVADYRIPPIWEYGAYRPKSALYSDLGKLTRYAAINLLFTTSPLYDPLNTTPGPGGKKVVHLEVLQDNPDSDGLAYIRGKFVKSKLAAFQPYYDWSVKTELTDPIDAGAKRALNIWAGVVEEDDCWNAYQDPGAELFCYFAENKAQYQPSYRPKDYVGSIWAFDTTDSVVAGLLGYADDNYTDGTQTETFAFDTPETREAGYGFTTTAVHEFGHHIGMSHPHDGYDSESAVDYGGSGEFYFAQSGDESNTMMSYIDLNWDFGQFDRDNMYRWETAGYLNEANSLAGLVLKHPQAWKVRGLLAAADVYAVLAKAEFRNWRYLGGVNHALKSYRTVQKAAALLGVSEPPEVAAKRAPGGRPDNHPAQPEPIHGPRGQR